MFPSYYLPPSHHCLSAAVSKRTVEFLYLRGIPIIQMSKHIPLPHIVTVFSEKAKWRKEVEGTRFWVLDNEKNTRILYIHEADGTNILYLIKVKIVNEGKLFQNSFKF